MIKHTWRLDEKNWWWWLERPYTTVWQEYPAIYSMKFQFFSSFYLAAIFTEQETGAPNELKLYVSL